MFKAVSKVSYYVTSNTFDELNAKPDRALIISDFSNGTVEFSRYDNEPVPLVLVVVAIWADENARNLLLENSEVHAPCRICGLSTYEVEHTGYDGEKHKFTRFCATRHQNICNAAFTEVENEIVEINEMGWIESSKKIVFNKQEILCLINYLRIVFKDIYLDSYEEILSHLNTVNDWDIKFDDNEYTTLIEEMTFEESLYRAGLIS